MGKYTIGVVPGDGVGKEVVDEGIRVMEVVGMQVPDLAFAFVRFDWGSEFYFRHGRMMPEEALVIEGRWPKARKKSRAKKSPLGSKKRFIWYNSTNRPTGRRRCSAAANSSGSPLPAPSPSARGFC